MAKRRGIFRRILDVFKGKPEPKPEPKITVPKPPIPPIPTSRRATAIDRMVNLGPLANRKNIVKNVGQMDDEELDFVLTATDDELRNRAKGDAYKVLVLTDGTSIPLNPFWYR